jgi:hypothetical protein
MEIYWCDWFDEKHGPHEVVCKDEVCWYVHDMSRPEILMAIPDILTTAKITKDGEKLPSVYEYVIICPTVIGVDWRLAKIVQVVH